MAPRITVGDLADTVSGLAEAQAQTTSQIGQILALVQAQHSTPTAVADAVTDAKPETPAAPASASDELLAFVTEQGLAFARGGRSYLTKEHLTGAVRVLKTGKPEVLPYGEGSVLAKRGVSHIAMARNADGSVLTQFVYTPES